MKVVNGSASQFALDDARVPPRLTPKRKPSAWLVLGVLAGVAVGMALFWFNPAQYGFYPFCYFHKLTGLNCPGCGGTRALHQLLHGNVVAALHLNALLVVSLPWFAWLGFRFARNSPHRRPAIRRASTNWFWAFVAVSLAFAVLRNLPAFAWLSP